MNTIQKPVPSNAKYQNKALESHKTIKLLILLTYLLNTKHVSLDSFHPCSLRLQSNIPA